MPATARTDVRCGRKAVVLTLVSEIRWRPESVETTERPDQDKGSTDDRGLRNHALIARVSRQTTVIAHHEERALRDDEWLGRGGVALRTTGRHGGGGAGGHRKTERQAVFLKEK